VLTGGIALLAVWAARRVTVPLGRFAQAAGRLGTDVNAPPIAEAGPSEIVQAASAFNQMQERAQRLVDDRTRMLAARDAARTRDDGFAIQGQSPLPGGLRAHWRSAESAASRAARYRWSAGCSQMRLCAVAVELDPVNPACV
jgi:hypothetical protein